MDEVRRRNCTDLALIATDDLLTELKARFDLMILIAEFDPEKGAPKGADYLWCFHGNPSRIIGTLDLHIHRLRRLHAIK